MLSRKEIDNLYAVAKKLDKEGFDVWENDVEYQGHGFKVILDKKFIDVRMFINVQQPNNFFISLHKKNQKHPNILDSIMCDKIKELKTSNANEVYELVKQLAM